jgi:hypothetical protein
MGRNPPVSLPIAPAATPSVTEIAAPDDEPPRDAADGVIEGVLWCAVVRIEAKGRVRELDQVGSSDDNRPRFLGSPLNFHSRQQENSFHRDFSGTTPGDILTPQRHTRRRPNSFDKFTAYHW